MPSDITVKFIDEVSIQVIAEPSIKNELSEVFCFMAANYQFMPSYKNKMWDGKIRLLNTFTGLILNGLLDRIKKFAVERSYSIEVDPRIRKSFKVGDRIGYEIAEKYKCSLTPHDYQNQAIYNVLNNSGRGLIISPTSSGKSMIMYLLARYFNALDKKVLIVVPLLSLLKQLPKEFLLYNNEEELDFGFYGDSKIINPEGDYIFTTWQSITNKPKEWFKQFDVVIGDEAHLFAAKSLVKILSNLTECEHRISLTGTLDESAVNQLTLEGLFGPTFNMVSTKELMDKGTVSALKINIITLKYNDEDRKAVSKFKSYQEEIDWLVANPKRNNFIKNLAINTKGNNLILFRYVEKHGDVLFKLLENCGRPVFYIHGDIDADRREEIRQLVEQLDDVILIASSGVFSTAVSVKRIHNIIRAHPMKGRVKNLQSIGRGLRLADDKIYVGLFDLVDDLSWKAKYNFSLKHGAVRLKTFTEEGFNYKMYNVNVK